LSVQKRAGDKQLQCQDSSGTNNSSSSGSGMTAINPQWQNLSYSLAELKLSKKPRNIRNSCQKLI